MGTVYHGKLVRDLIPTVIELAGKTPVSDLVSLNELEGALDSKLREEVAEFLESHSIEEMADILEVLHGIAFHKGISWEEVESVRVRKREERGGFEKGIRLLEVREP